MKPFEERNPLLLAAIGTAASLVVTVAALNYDKLPFFSPGRDYSAYFAEAGGLQGGSLVEVSGLTVGKVSSVDLDGPRVLVKFAVSDNIRLGDRTEAAIKLRSALGTKLLALTSRGERELTGPIPLNRTTPAYQLPDALADLSTTISGLNTDQLSKALSVVATEFANTPPDVKVAVQGVARLAQTLDERDKQLRNLLSNAHKVTKVLAERTDAIVSLVVNTNALLAQLRTQSSALDQISNNVSAASRQLEGFIADNRDTLRPALDKLNGVLAIIDNRKKEVQQSIKGLNAYGLGLGESVGSGPYFKAYLSNLPPGQFIQPFIDAAFSDLGLDPATLSPSQRVDPLTGQQATPPLPVPYPRTGQGGAPRLNLPDAITGKPGDPRYPLKNEPPAPPPGGSPPGPPALVPPGPAQSTPTPLGPLEAPAPGQIPPTQPPVLNGPGPFARPPTPPAAGGGR
jgi:phospholipid/cholesterol/gamma-HCH transport system substrate-binding protein